MNRYIVSALIVVLMVSSFGLIVSCSLEKPHSLDNISVNFNSHPKFVLKSSKGVSEKQLLKDEKIRDSLNKALADYPELSSMLEVDMIDGGGDSGYVYDGAESFFKPLQSFADENYLNAKSMFLDTTSEEFYYNAAIVYAIANKYSDLEIPYLEFEKGFNGKTYTPTFDEFMTFGFWMSYSSKKLGYFELLFDSNNATEPTSLDSLVGEKTFLKVQMALKKSLETGDIKIGEKLNHGDIILSNYLTKHMRDGLKNYGINKVSQDNNDHFSQIGNVIYYYGLAFEQIILETSDVVLKLGHLGTISGMYLHKMYSGFDTGAFHVASQICADTTETNICNTHVGFTEFNVDKWATSNIKSWGFGVTLPK